MRRTRLVKRWCHPAFLRLLLFILLAGVALALVIPVWLLIAVEVLLIGLTGYITFCK